MLKQFFQEENTTFHYWILLLNFNGGYWFSSLHILNMRTFYFWPNFWSGESVFFFLSFFLFYFILFYFIFCLSDNHFCIVLKLIKHYLSLTLQFLSRKLQNLWFSQNSSLLASQKLQIYMYVCVCMCI